VQLPSWAVVAKLLNDPAVASMFKAANITAGWQHCDQSWVVHGACGKFLPVPMTTTTTTTGNGTVLAQVGWQERDPAIIDDLRSLTDLIRQKRGNMVGKDDVMQDAMVYGCATGYMEKYPECGPKNPIKCNSWRRTAIKNFAAMSAGALDASIRPARTTAEDLETAFQEFLESIKDCFQDGSCDTPELREKGKNKHAEVNQAWDAADAESKRDRDCIEGQDSCKRDKVSCNRGMAKAVKALADQKQLQQDIRLLQAQRCRICSGTSAEAKSSICSDHLLSICVVMTSAE